MNRIKFEKINGTTRNSIIEKLNLYYENGLNINDLYFYINEFNTIFGYKKGYDTRLLDENNFTNIKNSIILLTGAIDQDSLEKSINCKIDNSIFICSNIGIDVESKISDCMIYCEYYIIIENSILKNTTINDEETCKIINCKIDSSSFKSRHTTFEKCNIINSTIHDNNFFIFLDYNISDSKILNTEVKIELEKLYNNSSFTKNIINSEFDKNLIAFSRETSITNVKSNNAIFYNDIDVTSEISSFKSDLSDFLKKYERDRSASYTIRCYLKKDLIVKNRLYSTNIDKIETFNFSHKLKMIFDTRCFILESINSIKISELESKKLFIRIVDNISSQRYKKLISSSDLTTVITKYKNDFYILNDDITKIKNLTFTPSLSEEQILKSVSNKEEFVYFIIGRNVYGVLNGIVSQKRNTILLGRFSSVLSTDKILCDKSSTPLNVSSLINNIFNAENYEFKQLDIRHQGNFNVQQNDKHITSNVLNTLIFMGGNISIIDMKFVTILRSNIEDDILIKSNRITNIRDYSNFVTHMGNYNSINNDIYRTSWLRNLTFSKDYTYFLTDELIFIIWDVNPSLITVFSILIEL